MGFFEEQQHENLIATIDEEIDKKLKDMGIGDDPRTRLNRVHDFRTLWNRINDLEKENKELMSDFEKACTVRGLLMGLLVDCMPLLPDNEDAKSIRERAAKFGL